MERSVQLAEQSIGKLLWNFSMPAIVGMLVSALYNIVDRIFIGHGLGSLALAGISLTFPIMIVTNGVGMLVGIGAGTLISIRLGQKRKGESEKLLGSAFSLLIIVSLMVSVLGYLFMDQILFSFGASLNTIDFAKQYLLIILSGIVFQNLGFGLNNLIRAEGNPKKAMYTMLIGAILNTILDPIFIFVFHMGVQGAAIATVISQIVNTIWVLAYFCGSKSNLKLQVVNFKLDLIRVKDIFVIGMAPFAMQIAASMINILFNKNLALYGGDLAVGAMGIINSVTMLILMPIFGICQGAQPIIGYNYGAKQYQRVKQTQKLAIIVATVFSAAGFLVVELFPKFVIGLFINSDVQLLSIGVPGIRIFLLMLPIVGFQIVSASFFQAIGKAKISMLFSMSRQVLILIPLLLVLPGYYKMNGVWLASPISDFLSSLLTGVFIFREMKRLGGTDTGKLAMDKSVIN